MRVRLFLIYHILIMFVFLVRFSTGLKSKIMNDREFLMWIHERLEYVYGENHLMDYMHKLRAIILSIPPEQRTNPICGKNSLEELKKEIAANEISLQI